MSLIRYFFVFITFVMLSFDVVLAAANNVPDFIAATMPTMQSNTNKKSKKLWNLMLTDLTVTRFTKNNYTTDDFYDVCDGITSGKSDEMLECVTIFDKTKVQPLQAVGLMELYVLYNHDYNRNLTNIPLNINSETVKDWDDLFVFNPKYRYAITSNNDFVQSIFLGGAGQIYYYDFEFDSITSASQQEIENATKMAICKVFGGCENKTIDDCKRIEALIGKIFGYGATWSNNTCYITTQDRIAIDAVEYNDGKTRYHKHNVINTIEGVDSFRFKNLKYGNLIHLQDFLEIYVKQNKTSSDDITDFHCDNAVQTIDFTSNDVDYYSQIYHVDIKPERYALFACRYNNSSDKIDFIFKNLAETSTNAIAGTESAIQCLSMKGAQYDGERCFGFKQDMCEHELNTKLKEHGLQGTRWDTTTETCILIDAQDAKKLKNFQETLSTAGEVALVAVTLPVSGAGVAATVAVTGIVATGKTVSAAIQNKQENIVRNVSVQANKCLTKERTASCAKGVLKNIIELDYQNYSIDDNQISTLDDMMAKLIALLPSDKQNTYSYYSGNTVDWLPAAKSMVDVMIVVAELIGAPESTVSSAKKTQNVVMLAKTGNARKSIAALKKLYNLYSKADNVNQAIEVVGTISEATKQVSNAATKQTSIGKEVVKTYVSPVDNKNISQNGDGKSIIKNKG